MAGPNKPIMVPNKAIKKGKAAKSAEKPKDKGNPFGKGKAPPFGKKG